MNTPTILTKYIVTFLLVAGVSACSFPEKRKPPRDQGKSEQSNTQQGQNKPTDNASSNTEAYSQMPENQPEAMVAQTQNVEQKHNTIRIRENASRHYTVKKGDTLWDISSQFLTDPWFWPEIWHKNKQVENPHLIYPGDVLTLIYIKGQPQIVVNETAAVKITNTTRSVKTISENGQTIIKLSPRIRKQGLDATIVTIPGDSIRQFLTKPRVVTQQELDNAPYILASEDDHMIMGEDNIIYVRGELDKERVRYTVFRPGDELIDPETEETLGFEAVYTGEAHITKYGDPATGRLTSTEREVLLGDRLLPLDKSKADNVYYPRTPDGEIKGQIVSLFDALFGIARFQVAVINRGKHDGLETGHLLETRILGATVRDRYDPEDRGDINLPERRSGLMMLFRVLDEVSYGLILESTNVINNHDVVASPK